MNLNSTADSPVIIGVGQCTHRPRNHTEAIEPLDLIEKAIHRAEEDSGISNLGQKIDTLYLVNILSESSNDPPSDLSRQIGIKPQNKAYTWIGASAPQWFVNQMSEKLSSGQACLGLICGGEALYSKKLMAKAKGKRNGMGFSPRQPWMAGDLRDPLNTLEMKYNLALPIYVYPLFENALRYHKGLDMEKQREELGKFCASLSTIAEKNPYSWFRHHQTPEEITKVSATNRMISFPYTKSMCSILDVDQAAAIFMTNEQTARDLGIPEEKWIYPIGSGDASDIWHVTERENFYSSPSAKVAGKMAMEQAGISLPEIDYIELYSCFPCATRIVRDMLGIPEDDPRSLTVTGGMPYFGGPGNNYALHGICNMVGLLRKNPAKIGLVHGLSWYISKHSIGIYSGDAARRSRHALSFERYQSELDKLILKGPELVENAEGKATVETYALFHDREGKPISAVIIGRLDNGSRFVSQSETDEGILNAMMEQECIGEKGRVRIKDGFNIFQF